MGAIKSVLSVSSDHNVQENEVLSATTINDLLVVVFNRLYHLLGSRVILAIDDIEFVDQESLSFLQLLFVESETVPILVATKGEDGAHAAHSRVDTSSDFRAMERAVKLKFEVQLSRLAKQNCDDLTRKIFAQSSAAEDPYGAAIVDDTVVDFIFSRAGGNPLYIHEMIKFVLGRKRVALCRHQGDTLMWKFTTENTDILNSGDGNGSKNNESSNRRSSTNVTSDKIKVVHGDVRDILIGRLEDCSFDAQSILKSASIIGKYFTRAELIALLDNRKFSITALSMQLDELVSANILVLYKNEKSDSETEDGSFSDSSLVSNPSSAVTRALDDSVTQNVRSAVSGVYYAFIHTSMHETVYNLLLSGHRRKLHKRFAEYLQKLEADPSLIVYHFERSSKKMDALKPYLRWGSRLMVLNETRRSIHVFEKATKIFTDLMKGPKEKQLMTEAQRTCSVTMCEYVQTYLKIMIRLLQQRLAYSSYEAKDEKDSIQSLFNNLNLFMERFGKFASDDLVLRTLSAGQWLTVFGMHNGKVCQPEVFDRNAKMLVQRGEKMEEPHHLARALAWEFLAANVMHDFPRANKSLQRLTQIVFQHPDPVHLSNKVSDEYGASFETSTIMAWRQLLILKGEIHAAAWLWERLASYAKRIKSGMVAFMCI